MIETSKFVEDATARACSAMEHCDHGAVLKAGGDLEGAIAEYRAALRVQPNNAGAHYDLGRALWTKGERESALEEFGAAHRLAPNEPTFRESYYDLMRALEH